jgi:toxin HigB-1
MTDGPRNGYRLSISTGCAIFAVLDRSAKPDDMNLPGFRLHPLKGELKGHWAVWVSGNWRVTFRFLEGDAHDVDYLDYH